MKEEKDTLIKNKKKPKGQDDAKAKNQEELINFLESKIDETEKKLHTTEKEYEVLKGDYHVLVQKNKAIQEKYKRTAFLLRDYLNEVLNQSEEVIQASQQDMHLNLEKVKDGNIEDLQPGDKIALVLVLLKQLQPFLAEHAPSHPSVLEIYN